MGQIAEETWKTSAKVDDLNSRVTRNEVVVQTLQAKVDAIGERLSSVENTAETIKQLTFGVVGGMILILIKEVAAMAGRKRRAEEGPGD